MRIDTVDEKILFYLKDDSARRRELEALASTKRIGKRRMEKLIKNGFVTSTKEWGAYELGPQGRAHLNSLSSPSSSFKDPKLIEMINRFPTEAHRAFMRLTLSGIVAKKLLFTEFDSNWPVSIIIGATKGLKTVSLEVICRLIKGLDPLRNVFPLYSGSPGEFGVRRHRVKGKVDFEISESRFFKEIFAGLDEWDKASPELKMKSLFFAEGKREFLVEGKKVANHAYAVIAANPEPKKATIPEPIIRRSVVLNTDSLMSQFKDVELVAREILELLSSRHAPQLDIQKLPVIRKKLSKRDFTFLHALFMGNVKKNYYHLVDTAPLQMLALGRASLLKSKNIRQAILETVWDRLECLETMGGVKELWRERLVDIWKRQGPLPREVLAQLKKVREIKEKTSLEKERATAQQVGRIRENLVFAARKENAIIRLRRLRDKLPQSKEGGNRYSAVRKKINNLIKQLRTVRKEEDFELYEQVLSEIEAEVTALSPKSNNLPEKEEKEAPSRKLLRKLIEEWIGRKKTLSQDNIIDKLESVECVYKRVAVQGTKSSILEISFLLKGKEVPPVFDYYEGIDGKTYLPDDLDNWDKARPLLVKRLKQLERGEEDEKITSQEERLKSMVDWVLKDKEKWPDWFKNNHDNLIEEKINGTLKNPDKWPKWFQEFSSKLMDEKLGRRLNEEFQRQVSVQVANNEQRLKTTLFPQYINRYIEPKAAELTGLIYENVFKLLEGPWEKIICPKCQGEISVTLGEEEIEQLLKTGKLLIRCPFQTCKDMWGDPYAFSVRLENFIRYRLAS